MMSPLSLLTNEIDKRLQLSFPTPADPASQSVPSPSPVQDAPPGEAHMAPPSPGPGTAAPSGQSSKEKVPAAELPYPISLRMVDQLDGSLRTLDATAVEGDPLA